MGHLLLPGIGDGGCGRARGSRKLRSQLIHRARAVLRQNLQPIHQRIDDISGELLRKFAGHHQPIVRHAGGRLQRRAADQRAIKHGAKGIDIRPGALLPLKAILLNCRIARKQLRREVSPCSAGLPDAEASNPHFSILPDDQGRGGNAAVDDPRTVQRAEGRKHGHK